MTLRELMKEAREKLAITTGDREAAALVDEMMWRIKGWSRTDTIIHGDESTTEFLQRSVNDTVEKLLAGNPIQYIFGKAQFYGLDFIVTPDTLIPRPETAQLVDMIIDRYGEKSDMRVLDLGTGSGCIAIALARHLPFPDNVTAVDFSAGALSVASRNSRELKVNIDCVKADMLSASEIAGKINGKFNIIVSNPPYIAQFEAAEMERHVLDHEPHTALFVPDDDPLLFYRAIARIASERLEDNGTLFLEINPLFAKELADMLRDNGFQDIDIERDMQKVERFIIAKR